MAADNNLPVVGSSSVAHDEAPLTEEQRRRLEEYMEEEEGALNRYRGVLAVLMTAAAVVMSLFHLYAAIEIVPAYILRPVHVAFALALVFLLFPAAKRFRHRLMWFDVILALVSVAIIAYILYWGDELGDRATVPTSLDVVVGVALIVLILVPFSAPFQTYDVAQILVQRHSRQEPAPARASTDLRASASHVIPASRIAARVRLIGDSDSRTRTVVVAHPFSSARSAALQPPPHSPLSATAKLRI